MEVTDRAQHLSLSLSLNGAHSYIQSNYVQSTVHSMIWRGTTWSPFDSVLPLVSIFHIGYNPCIGQNPRGERENIAIDNPNNPP